MFGFSSLLAGRAKLAHFCSFSLYAVAAGLLTRAFKDSLENVFHFVLTIRVFVTPRKTVWEYQRVTYPAGAVEWIKCASAFAEARERERERTRKREREREREEERARARERECVREKIRERVCVCEKSFEDGRCGYVPPLDIRETNRECLWQQERRTVGAQFRKNKRAATLLLAAGARVPCAGDASINACSQWRAAREKCPKCAQRCACAPVVQAPLAPTVRAEKQHGSLLHMPRTFFPALIRRRCSWLFLVLRAGAGRGWPGKGNAQERGVSSRAARRW
jgi:hypothetical protein